MCMDVSSFLFYHCDLGPGNILADPAKSSIGTADWELAGYVPREWIKTKFNLSSGMDLPVGGCIYAVGLASPRCTTTR